MSDQTAELVADEQAEHDAERELELEADAEAFDPAAAVEVAAEAERELAPAPAAEPPSEVAAERAYSELERAAKTYATKVGKIQAATDLGLVECPLCPVPGYVIVPAPEDIPEDVILAVQSYLAGPEAGPPNHPLFERCPLCDGWADLPTGSRVGMVKMPCPRCNGQGYVDKLTPAELAPANGAGYEYLPPAAGGAPDAGVFGELPAGQVEQGGFKFVPIPGASSDPAGRTAGHPLWGQPREAGGL